MRHIKPIVLNESLHRVKADRIDRSEAIRVSSYRQLVERIAGLAYLNKDHILFFRGQDKDYQHKGGGSTVYPTIYRGDSLRQHELTRRFDVLRHASRELSRLFKKSKFLGHRDVARKVYIKWSILQHYEVCPTPLLDLTQSIRVACSFAQADASEDHCFVFVFGLPYATNRIAINSEHDLVNVRLLSNSPPDALRPYFQEGYLAGTSDVTTEYESKSELDFRRRLIAKFRISKGAEFWGSGFDSIPEEVLYPEDDKIDELCKEIKDHLVGRRLLLPKTGDPQLPTPRRRATPERYAAA